MVTGENIQKNTMKWMGIRGETMLHARRPDRELRLVLVEKREKGKGKGKEGEKPVIKLQKAKIS